MNALAMGSHRDQSAAVTWVKQVTLWCGVASALLYAAMNVIVPMHDPAYQIASQTVSELSAIGAPTRTLWVAMGSAYTVLLIAFGVGVWLAADSSRLLRVTGTSFVLQGLIGPFWPPMHQRTVLAAGGGDSSDVGHIAFTVIWGLLAVLLLICGAVAVRGRFRAFSMATLGVILVFGALTGMDSPRMEAGLPTPLIGVWERINIGAFMLWTLVFALLLIVRGRAASGRC